MAKKEKSADRAKDKKKPKKGNSRSKAESKGKTRGKGKSKDRSKGKASNQSKGKAKKSSRGKSQDRSKGKEQVKAESGGRTKGKSREQVKAKSEGKSKGRPKDKSKEKSRGKDKTKDSQRSQDEELNQTRSGIADKVSQGVTAAAQRRWKQVAVRLGLEEQITAVAAWDGSSTPPILTGFSFVRHVESDARDLVCAGTSVHMTQGVIVERQDGKSFLTGRGVAAKFLGLQVPWKDRASAGQRALSAHERVELGQPEAQGAARSS